MAALALAFTLGIALALSVLWIDSRLEALSPQKRLAATDGGQKAAAPPAKKAVRVPFSAANKASPAAPRGQSSASGPDGSARSAVASALVDLKALPYEESLGASLDERIRQADYALMQAAWMRQIPASGLRLVSVEDRLEGVEPYQYQVIDVLPGATGNDFKAALQSSLAAWAEEAVLRELDEEHWLILVRGVETHRLRLFPGHRELPSLPARRESGQDRPDRPGAKQSEADPSGRIQYGEEQPGRGGPDDFSSPPLPRPGIDRRLRAPDESAGMVIVVDDLGASPEAVQQLLALDYPVTFAFWPHGGHTRPGAEAARLAGREILIHQPMEPMAYPRVNPGPGALLIGMPAESVRKTLDAAVAAVPHAVGLNNHMGSRFTRDREAVGEVVAALKRHGLFALDSLTHETSVFAAEARRHGLETYQRQVFLDVMATRSGILNELRRAERIALLTGQCVAIGHPLPETLAALKEWQRLRNREVRLCKLRELGKR